MSGRGIQPTGLRVDDVAVFHVTTHNSAPDDLDVSVSRSHAATQEPVTVVNVSV